MARVRSLHAQNMAAETARAGDRCALNLAGPGIEKEAIRRGDVVLDPGLHAPTDRIDAIMRLLPGEKKPIRPVVSGSSPPRRVGSEARGLSRSRTARRARAMRRTSNSYSIGRSPRRPWIAMLIRDVSAQRTLGGGVFLDLRRAGPQAAHAGKAGATCGARDPRSVRVLRRALGRSAFRRRPCRLCPRPRSFRRTNG